MIASALSSGSKVFPKIHDRLAVRSYQDMTNIESAKVNIELFTLFQIKNLLCWL